MPFFYILLGSRQSKLVSCRNLWISYSSVHARGEARTTIHLANALGAASQAGKSNSDDGSNDIGRACSIGRDNSGQSEPCEY